MACTHPIGPGLQHTATVSQWIGLIITVAWCRPFTCSCSCDRKKWCCPLPGIQLCIGRNVRIKTWNPIPPQGLCFDKYFWTYFSISVSAIQVTTGAHSNRSSVTLSLKLCVVQHNTRGMWQFVVESYERGEHGKNKQVAVLPVCSVFTVTVGKNSL